jgi:TRAP-type C4-dicarboxylate transport system permease small subunit
MRRFVGYVQSISRYSGYFSAGLVMLALVLIVVNVFARRVLGRPILWGEELGSYLLMGIVFLGMSYTMLTEGHVRVDIVLSKFTGRNRVIFEMACSTLGIFYSLILFGGSFFLFREFYMKRTLSTMELQIPLFIPAIVLSIGCFFLLLQIVARLLSVKGYPDEGLRESEKSG